MIRDTANGLNNTINVSQVRLSRRAIVAAILIVALVAFEIFNFDTTQYALRSLLGDVRFMGLFWASILAIAFCAIDFAGLVRLFTPERGREEPRAVWFLTGAWFLGTIANAIMTWWAVSLTLLGHEFGNEVLSREALLRYVPIFVAILVWLTRILFIGAFAVAGEEIMDARRARAEKENMGRQPVVQALPPGNALPARPTNPAASAPSAAAARDTENQSRPGGQSEPMQPQRRPQTQERGTSVYGSTPATTRATPSATQGTSRIHQRPPMPGASPRPASPGGANAKPTGSVPRS